MTDHFKQFDALRRRLGAIDNDLIDELLAGRLDRRSFLRHGAMLGLSLPVLGSMASLAGLGAFPTPARAQGKPGGVIRVAIATPAGAIDPVTVADDPGLTMLIQAGEFLCVTQPDLTLKPVLAESWTHNDDTSVWTFKLRPNVKYQSGGTMVAADVVASIDRLCDPANSSNALSAFKGILSKGKTKALDDLTVQFTPRGALRVVPLCGLVRQLQLHHPAGELQRRLREELGRHRPLPARQVHAEGRCVFRAQRRLLGQQGPAGPGPNSPSTMRSSPGSWRCRAGRST